MKSFSSWEARKAFWNSALHSVYIELVLTMVCCISDDVTMDDFLVLPLLEPSASCRSWYCWKQGTIHRLVWHSGQWYLVFRRRIRPWASTVFQQKLQPSAGPCRNSGQWLERHSGPRPSGLRLSLTRGGRLNVLYCGVDELRRNSSTLRGRLLDDSVGEVTWKEGERGVKVEEVEMMRGWECCLVR